MLGDVRSRRAWRLFRLRVEYVLGALPRSARRDILNDFDEHFAEALRRKTDGGEFENVSSVLDQMGDPREFLRPLIADAVFARPAPPVGVGLLWQGAAQALQRGMAELGMFLGLSCAVFFGVVAAIFGLRRIVAPQRAGLFAPVDDDYQLHLWGGSEIGGAQLLPAWAAAGLIAIGVWIVWRCIHLLARQAIRLMLG